MRLKRAILEVMSHDLLKAIVEAFEIDGVDRRSRDDMVAALGRSRRATAEALLAALGEREVKDVCERRGVSPTGRKQALIERLLLDADSGNGGDGSDAGGGGRRDDDAAEPAPRRASAASADEVHRGSGGGGGVAKRARSEKREKREKQVTRYTHDDVREPATPETGHTALLPADEQVVALPLDNGWTKAIHVSRLPEDPRPVVVDMDPAADPVLFWAGKRSRRDVPVLPLQRNEVVSESRIAQIIDRARKAAAATPGKERQGTLFAGLERELRASGRAKRVEFYTHDEGWKNKLICGDSLQVMESLLHYEGLGGKVQMIYMDPPYGIKYDSNFQQRIDSTKNDDKDRADDVLTIKAFRDTWALGIHSYLSYLQERLYLCRELLADTGSVFVQIGDENVHLVRAMLEEVFGRDNFVSQIAFYKTSGKGAAGLDAVYDTLLWYSRNRSAMKFTPLYRLKTDTLAEQYTLAELPDGSVRRMTADEIAGAVALPAGTRRFMPDQLSSQGETATGSQPFGYGGREYQLPPNSHWKTSIAGMKRLAERGRLYPIGNRLRYRRYADDFPVAPFSNIWDDTVISDFADAKLYAVQTSPKVVERCLLLTTSPGDLVLDPTCGSGTAAYCAEKLGRRWITCDTSRVAINVCRRRLLSAVLDHYRLKGSTVAEGFLCRTIPHITLKSLANDLEPEQVDLVDQPEVDRSALRVTGPFEVMTLGRYSVEDWKGFVVGEGGGGTGPAGGPELAKLENYIEVICRLYRKDAAIQGASGLVHAIAESESERLAISVGPLTGRVTARQIHEAVQDAMSSGVLEVHVLGWAFEANVGEVKSQLEKRGKVKIELIMIRPDTLAEGLKATQPEMLFSPLALPDIEVKTTGKGDQREAVVTLNGVAVFDRKQRTTQYYQADQGYIAAWYLDEDYDGDCFVDCQMFFDFQKAPNLKALAGVEVDADEYALKLASEPFPVGAYKRIAVKVVDVYGNESTLVRDLG